MTIEGLQRQIDLTRSQLESIPRQFGFKDVRGAEAAYKVAKTRMETLKVQPGIVEAPIEVMCKSQSQEQRISALKELAAKRLEMQQQKVGNKKNKKYKRKFEL